MRPLLGSALAVGMKMGKYAVFLRNPILRAHKHVEHVLLFYLVAARVSGSVGFDWAAAARALNYLISATQQGVVVCRVVAYQN